MRAVRAMLFYWLCLLHVTQYPWTGLHVPDVLMVVGVLSAQNNSAARNSIRHSWKNLVSITNSRFYFLVGKDFCQIHPNDRLSEASCQDLAINWPPDLPFNHRLWTSDVSKNFILNHHQNVVTSFTFRTRFPVILRGMRVMNYAIMILNGAVARLKNAQNGEYVTAVQFNYQKNEVSEHENEWKESETKSFLLPKNFDGEFELLSFSSYNKNGYKPEKFSCQTPSEWFDIFGTIQFTSQYGHDTGWVPVSNHSCVPMSLQFELYELQSYLTQKDIRRKQWIIEVERLSKDLDLEARVEKDLLFLDVVDVYENLPKKLLAFFKRIHEDFQFHFVLKVDDDTFVDIPVVERYLHAVAGQEALSWKETHLWWWGSLRFSLPVARHGKWQELHYRAPVYPPFPCGGGYVLHRNIVNFLVNNYQWLHHFQGEDTSLGIWLSGTQPHHPYDAACKWASSDICGSSPCNRIQLTVEEMHTVWQLYQDAKPLCQHLSRNPSLPS